MNRYLLEFSEALDNIIGDVTEAAVTNVELQMQIDALKRRYRAEMTSQNQQGSVARSYAGADRIQAQIQDLERKLRYQQSK